MIVTEEILASHRNENGFVRISARGLASCRKPLADVFFSSTIDEFPFIQVNGASVEASNILVVLAFMAHAPILKSTRMWFALAHKAGGYQNEYHRMIATRLKPRQNILPGLTAIAREGFFAAKGHFGQSDLLASRISKYVHDLSLIGLDCECTWRNLTESLYPVDATQENLDRIAEDAPLIAELADWSGSGLGLAPVRYSADPVILFMVQNSD